MPTLQAQRCTGGLLERGAELARIDAAIAALEQGSGDVLVIQGAAGIGKSTLLRSVCEQAAERGMQTLTARASELEHDFGFGVVRQLLEARMVRASKSERAELLTGAAALASPVLGVGGGSSGNAFAALHGLYWLVANLAVSGPVVLAVDDLQWADEPSLRWLAYLCHRLEGLPVLVAATTRPPRPGHSQLVAELLAIGRAQILCPNPLTEPAVARLVRDGLAEVPDPAFVAACARASAGNPFVLRELILDLAADGVAPVAAQAAGVAERVPEQVERTVLARLRRLDAAAAQLAEAVAVLGEGTGLRLAAEMANLDLDAAAAAADALLTAELFDEGRPLQFLHPLVRSAVYEQLAPGARALAHARAARLLVREGAGSAQVGAQLLLCEPAGDAQAVRALRAAAAAAVDRGAPETAVTYLRRALAEPPADDERAAVLGELGGAERIARDPAALVHLERAWQATTCPVARALLAEQLANVLFYATEWTRCSAVLRAALGDLGDGDPDLAVRLCTHAAVLELLTLCPTEAPEVALRRLRDLAARSTPASRAAQLCLAAVLAVRGRDRPEVAGLVQRGLDGGRFAGEAVPAMLAVWALVVTDDLDGARALIETILADARARGSVVGFQSASGRRALVAMRRGELAEAEADARASLEMATEYNLALSIPLHAATLGLVLLERGELDQAAAAVEGVALPGGGAPTGIALLEARGRVRLARGQRAQAIADLRHCGRLASVFQATPNIHAWRSTLALALASADPKEARALANTELELARCVGAPRAIGIALRVCGLLADAPRQIELLEQSVAVLEPTPMRLELAYSLTELGAALRRAGSRAAAREPLRRALDLAVRCGATPLAERAREEAVAAGARPRRPWTTGVDALTPSELRVVRLAAQDMGNRDIAQALFITAKTVSDHLSSAYRKLNISSRDQLAEAMLAHMSPSPHMSRRTAGNTD